MGDPHELEVRAVMAFCVPDYVKNTKSGLGCYVNPSTTISIGRGPSGAGANDLVGCAVTITIAY